MNDSLDELHAQVALVALGGNSDIVHVYDGVVPSPTPNPPYVLLYQRIQWPRDGLGTALTSTQKTITTTITAHCVGLSPQAARAVQMQVRATLLNLRPIIPGRNCSPIKQDEQLEPDRDETTGRLVIDAISTYSFSSTG